MSELPPWPWVDGKPKGEIVARAAEARIGVYVMIETDRRVYARDENGRSSGGPLPRYGFEPALVHGETKVSWLVGSEWCPEKADRYPKVVKAEKPGRRFYGLEEVEDHVWLAEHSYRLGSFIGRLNDASLLQRIAQMVHYPDALSSRS